MNATRMLAGRREGDLLALPSVRRMTDILAQRCRASSWVRTSVASLDRFRAMTGSADLEALREQALVEPAVAEQALARFALALAAYSDIQVSALAMGAKLWFRLNGIAVPWRPLGGTVSAVLLPAADPQGAERVILLALIGSGLRLAELLRLRIGDIGSLDGEGHLIPDSEADPLAVQFTPRRGTQVARHHLPDLPGAPGVVSLAGTRSSSGRRTATGRAADNPGRWLASHAREREARQAAQPVVDPGRQRSQCDVMSDDWRLLP